MSNSNSYKPKVIALVVAAGRGQRFQEKGQKNLPKQYHKIEGVPILRKTIEKFLSHPDIDAIQVVIHQDDLDLYHDAINGLSLLPACYGGETRQISVFNGLNALETHHPDYVLIHDAARPNPTEKLISELIDSLSTHKASCPVVSSTNSLKVVKKGKITQSLDRSTIWQAQTPQAFHYPLIYDLHYKQQDRAYSDDISLLNPYEHDIKAVEGDDENFKVTFASDIEKMKMNAHIEYRTGFGFDVHAFSKEKTDKKLIIGGIVVDHPYSLIGHSDADVVLHAITDALLGAVGQGDIGEHFPPSDPKWKGKDSSYFLEFACQKIQEKQGSICNIDVTIICEKPKISHYKEKMVEKISKLTKLESDRVNIKATTTEKLGFVGREEGIACQANTIIKVTKTNDE